MIKSTLNTASLLLLAIFSTSSIASSPWAVEEAEAAEEEDNQPVVIQQDSRPATMDMDDESMDNAAIPAMEEPMQEEPMQEVTSSQYMEQPAEVTEQQGDVLSLPQNTQAQAIGVRILEFPRRGMSTSKVENELGRPAEIIPAIGQPPISRWVYDDRVVYFERSTVIHVVAK